MDNLYPIITPSPVIQTYQINEPTADIAARRARWQKNRDFQAGGDEVKARGEGYLPRNRVDDSNAEYRAHLQRTNFYPAVAKISQGISGLIGRKKAQLNSTSASVQLLARLITQDRRSLDQLAAWVVRETQITNFTGLLVDEPGREGVDNLSAANAYQRGYRPYLAPYCAESILEVTEGIQDGDVQLVCVRLLEDDGRTVRQLRINDEGRYEVIIHRQETGGQFKADAAYVPRVGGQPLTSIPFTLINTDDVLTPTPALLEAAVDINLQHYLLSGILAGIIHLTSGPITTITGYTPKLDENGRDPFTPDVSAGAMWMFEDEKVEVEHFIFKPEGSELLLGRAPRDQTGQHPPSTMRPAGELGGHGRVGSGIQLGQQRRARERRDAGVVGKRRQGPQLVSVDGDVDQPADAILEMVVLGDQPGLGLLPGAGIPALDVGGAAIADRQLAGWTDVCGESASLELFDERQTRSRRCVAHLLFSS